MEILLVCPVIFRGYWRSPIERFMIFCVQLRQPGVVKARPTRDTALKCFKVMLRPIQTEWANKSLQRL